MSYRQVSLHPLSRIAPNATILGNVTIGAESLVLFNSVLRGDCCARIVIGQQTNLQEMCCIHVSEGFDCIVGDGVTVGHGAVLHGCRIEDNTLIGMGAIILNGARIGENCIVGAGALVTQNMVVPDDSLVLGNPAKIKRKVTEQEMEANRLNAKEYVKESRKYKEGGRENGIF